MYIDVYIQYILYLAEIFNCISKDLKNVSNLLKKSSRIDFSSLLPLFNGKNVQYLQMYLIDFQKLVVACEIQ